MNNRTCDTEHFYGLLAQLEENVGGKRRLKDCHWNMSWPERGVYFFFEDSETRANSRNDFRVVRVGIHAVNANSKSRLWNRLYEHKQDGGRSVFRDHVNRALKSRSKCMGNDREHNHTRCISDYIRGMPFLWVNVDGDDSHRTRRKIERNAIGLLSAWRNDRVDAPSEKWLGRYSDKEQIKRSGLWNVQHVKGGYASSFLGELKPYVENTKGLAEPTTDWDSTVCVECSRN